MNDLTLKTVGMVVTLCGFAMGIGGAWMNLNVRLGIVETNLSNTTDLLREIKNDSKEIRAELYRRNATSR